MNCAQIHDMLPALIYGDLSPEKKNEVEDHLATCPSCREDRAALTEVGRLLDAAPEPRTQVNVSRIYEEASRHNQKQGRRWRRAALIAMSAAAVLLVVFGLKLEVRWERDQVVLRWGVPLQADPALEQRPDKMVERPSLPNPRPEVTAADLQLVKDLVHALAANVEERDGKFQQSLALLELQLNQAQQQARTTWAATERYVSALHTSQMDSHVKGEKR